MSKKLRVLAVGAHPDDLEILCAGTLAKYAKLGHEVVMAYATNGDMGHMLIPPKELAKVREEEARNSAKLIGASVIWLGLPDEWVFHDKETRVKFIDMVREAKPDVIITHSPNDYHPDHRATADLVFGASFLSSVPNIKTEYEFYPQVVPIYFMDTLAGIDFLPAEYVDITETVELKKAMLGCHRSQVKWLKDHDNIDIVDFVVTQAKFRGLQAGVAYAEGFRRFYGWPRVTAERLLP